VQRSNIKNMCIMIESYINEIIAAKSMDKHTHTQKTFYTHQKKSRLYEKERKKKRSDYNIRFLFFIRSNFVVEPVDVRMVGVESLVLDD
jgi:hypothetical protein